MNPPTYIDIDVNTRTWAGLSNFSNEYNETLSQIARDQPETQHRNKINGLETSNLLGVSSIEKDLRPLLGMWYHVVNNANALPNNNKDWGFTELWSHITKDTIGQYQPHNHGHGFWSGLYYPKAPEGSGELVWYSNDSWQGAPGDNTMSLKPVTGMWVIFPPTLLHWTRPNQKNVERICYAFNSTTANDERLITTGLLSRPNEQST